MGQAHGALVVRPLLQTILRAEAAHEKRPLSIVALLRRHVGDAVLGDHPHRVAQVFDDAHDTRSEETAVHVEQRLTARLTVVDTAARHGSLPEESAAVLHHAYRGGSCRGLAGLVGNLQVDHLAADGIDEREEGGVAHQQPASLDPVDGGHEILAQRGVIGAPGGELSRLAVQPLHAVAERPQPDVAPLVLGHRPDIVVEQSVLGPRGQDVSDAAAGGNLDQSAVIGAKPERAVAGAVGGHHRVGCETCRLVDELALLGPGVVLDDTLVVRSQPVGAILTLDGGVDVTQLDVADAGHLLDILVETVAIGADPHVSRMVEHQMLDRILAQGGIVVLVVQKLLDLLGLEVYDDESLMVGGQPHPSAMVHLGIPQHQVLR